MAEETRVCRICQKEKPLPQMRPGKRICYACSGVRERARLKLDMLEALGFKCNCCGEQHPHFLTLQHKIPGSSYGATGLKSHQLYRIARSEGWPKDKYEVLCMNCNFAEAYFGGCPHRNGLSVGDAIMRLRNLDVVLEHDYSVLTDRQREALKLGPESQVNPKRSVELHLAKFGLKLEDVLARLKEKKE